MLYRITTGGEVAKVKLAPDAYIMPATQPGVDPLHCVVFEDTDVGIIVDSLADIRCRKAWHLATKACTLNEHVLRCARVRSFFKIPT